VAQSASESDQPRPLDLIESATRQIAGHVEGLLALGRELDALPARAHDWTGGSRASEHLSATVIEGPTAYVDAWLRYTDVLRPSPTVAVKTSGAGFNLFPWEQIDLLAQQAAAGSIRMIIGEDPLDEVATTAVQHLVNHGLGMRLMHEPPLTFFATTDGTTVLSTQWGVEFAPSVLVLRNRHVSKLVIAWFETLWGDSLPYETTAERWAPILDLMNRGLDDEQIAARLGWSVRTVRRRVNDAMSELGVPNRYALGRAWALRRQ
jgi:hypothetical protein